MAPRASLRASDADRETVAERLRVAAGEGRLDTDELDERLDAALRARTYGDLDRLVVDLPSGATLRPRRSTGVVPVARSALAIALPVLMTTLAVAAVITVMVAAAAWWIACALFWVLMCGGRSCSARYLHPPRGWPGHAPARGMRGTRPARLG